MTIYVVRHAESMHNRQGKITGMGDDSPLSNQGVVQSVILLERIIKDIGDAQESKYILSSPSIRAIQTAIPLSQYFRTFIETDYHLIERNTGRASGVEEKLVIEQIPLKLREFIPCIEPESSLNQRAQNIAEKVKNYEGDLFIFTHRIFARYLIPVLSGDASLRISLDNADFYKINGSVK